MKKAVYLSLTSVFLILLLVFYTNSNKHGQIYLYGESHGIEDMINCEYETWYKFYHEDNMRDQFIEMSCYHSDILNSWMKASDDDILDSFFEYLKGTLAYNEYNKNYFIKIKRNYPKTVFHGTDIGHQYNTLGKDYLNYLRENNLEHEERYSLALEAVKQGEKYYTEADEEKGRLYREKILAENFARDFDRLEKEM